MRLPPKYKNKTNREDKHMNNKIKSYPLKFKPIYKERIWGGDGLKTYFAKDTPAGVKIGESWELVDLPGNHSQIVNGPLAGKTIDEVFAEHGEQISGSENYRPPFPLLIKLLDARDVLSLQVHPDAEVCRKIGKGAPKTECWYIIDAKEGAYIYKSLKQGTTVEQFRKSIEQGNCADYLEKVEVNVGECHFLPSGTVHAIGAGLLIAEIQQPSDTTYRVYDWNRVDENTGRPRELHIEDALESIHFDSSKDNLSVESTGRLADSDEFKVDKGHRAKGNEVLIDAAKMQVFIIIKGVGRIEAADVNVENFSFMAGDTFLIPADFIGTIIAEEEIEYLRVSL
jgi:mannose-6-phosphate isomerase